MLKRIAAAGVGVMSLLIPQAGRALPLPITLLRAFSAMLPNGEGKILVFKYCVMCRGAKLTRKRLQERKGWKQEDWEDLVSEMMDGWGATMEREEVEPIAEYLVANFGPSVVKSSSEEKDKLEGLLAPGDPKKVILAKCTSCHDREVTGQRLESRAGLPAPVWKRLLIRMKAYGAPVTSDEIEQLSNYLASSLGSQTKISPVGELYSYLPEGSGKELVMAYCLSCHGVAELKRRIEDGSKEDQYYWERVVFRMKKQWESPLEDEEADAISNSLNSHFAKQ